MHTTTLDTHRVYSKSTCDFRDEFGFDKKCVVQTTLICFHCKGCILFKREPYLNGPLTARDNVIEVLILFFSYFMRVLRQY